jgi:hypothetical protein
MPNGEFLVPDEWTVLSPNGVLGYILAQYIDGDDEEPTRSECVDPYIENAIQKLKAYLFKLLQLRNAKNSKNSPPLRKD